MGEVEDFYESLNGGRTYWSTQNMNEFYTWVKVFWITKTYICCPTISKRISFKCQLELLYTKMWKFAEKSNASVTMSQ